MRLGENSESAITAVLVHNGPFPPDELIGLFDIIGFNRLGEWNARDVGDIFEHTDWYVLALVDEKLIGFVRLLTDWHTRGYLSNLCVHPNFRRRGIGKALMYEILRVCDEHGIPVTNVYDTSDNPGFYDAFGFVTDENAVGMYRIHRSEADVRG